MLIRVEIQGVAARDVVDGLIALTSPQDGASGPPPKVFIEGVPFYATKAVVSISDQSTAISIELVELAEYKESHQE